MYACIHSPGNQPLLIECARGFSPYIEETSPDTVVFDVRGLESLYGPPPQLAFHSDGTLVSFENLADNVEA